MDKPIVFVAVLVYNHEKYIEETLQSILVQSGNFTIQAVIFDDASTDSTQDKIESFLATSKFPSHITFEYRRNAENVGMVKNFRNTIRTSERTGATYFTILEGDDYWLTNRVQKNVEFLQSHPHAVLSFNQFRFFYQDTQSFSKNSTYDNLHGNLFNGHELANDNFIGNNSCAFVCNKFLSKVPDALFDFFVADWMFHIWLAQYGQIGYVEEPLSVYRKHNESVWTGKSETLQCKILYDAIKKFNVLTDYEFDKEMQKYVARLNGIFGKLDLAIIDDVFPITLSPFRYVEFTSYLEEIENTNFFCSGFSLPHLTQESNNSIITEFKRSFPQYADKIIAWENHHIPPDINAKLFYFCFLLNCAIYLDTVERSKTPFAFELYPGGGFLLNETESDERLCTIMSSPYFRKVIVTQKNVEDYLIENGFCSEDKITNIFGVVTPREKLEAKLTGMCHYGKEKQKLDICFVAFKYTPRGEDKGYDVFVDVAKKLFKMHDNIFFHVVGGFDADTIDVSELSNRITFYGKRTPDWFTSFYVDKDIILSPNMHGKLNKGAFDGFPTAACTDAALSETAMFCTDPLELNDGRFIPNEEMIIVKHDVDEIVETIENFYHNPELLTSIAVNGKKKVQNLYSYDVQIAPRIKMLKEEIAICDGSKASVEKQFGASLKQHPFSLSGLYVDTGDGFSEENRISGTMKWFENNKFIVWFKLPENTKCVRFDPTESFPVKCKNVCAACNENPIELLPVGSVVFENWDSFLSADSQYISHTLPANTHGVFKIQGEIKPLETEEIKKIVEQLSSNIQTKKNIFRHLTK